MNYEIYKSRQNDGRRNNALRSHRVSGKNHPNSPNNKMFQTVYDWFVFTLFCDNIDDFHYKFGETSLFVVINAMPIGYMRDKLNMTFDL